MRACKVCMVSFDVKSIHKCCADKIDNPETKKNYCWYKEKKKSGFDKQVWVIGNSINPISPYISLAQIKNTRIGDSIKRRC